MGIGSVALPPPLFWKRLTQKELVGGGRQKDCGTKT
jgi:hypothetical protein